MMKYVLSIALFLLASSFSIAEEPPKQSASGLMVAEQQNATLAQFVKAASMASDAESLIPFAWPTTVEKFGLDIWRKHLTNNVIPFFAGAGTVDKYKGLSSFMFPFDGGVPAVVHFGYAIDSEGKRKPFEIVMVTTDKGIFVANVYVGTCQKGLHPICE